MIFLSSILFILLGPVLWITLAVVVIYLIGRRIDEYNSETFDKRDN
ncbi:MAG: hypothetical protein HEP71_20705 [Roseivirga sp.]|nr:hypothetical protein [Roseivirga sp.]